MNGFEDMLRPPSDPQPDPTTCEGEGCAVEVEAVAFMSRWSPRAYCDACEMRQREERATLERVEMYRRQLRDTGLTEFELENAPRVDLPPTVVRWAEESKRGEAVCAVFLTGPVGTGKSTASIEAIKRRIWRAVRLARLDEWGVMDRSAVPYERIVYVTESDFIRARYPGDRQRPLAHFADATVLVFDEVGTSKPTDFSAAELTDLVNRRYRERLPTLFVSNCDLGELVEDHDSYDDRIVTRIAEMCGAASLADYDRVQIRMTYSHRLQQELGHTQESA